MTKIQNTLNKYDIKPNKLMGQNFLIDENVLDKIIEAAEIKKDDTILEVGPGLGILTIELAKKAKQVIAIEKDKKMCEVLQELLDAGNVRNVKIVNKDILKISNLEFLIPNQIRNSNFKIDSKFEIQNYKLVANIPYYLTSPLIRKFLETKIQPNLMILMIQKEVAERIIAKPTRRRQSYGGQGKMSILSVAVQFYAKPEIIGIVSKNSFYPKPKVDSAIIKIIPKTFPKVNTEKFFELVKAGFSSKRKTLVNNLSRKFPPKAMPTGRPMAEKINKAKLELIFKKMGINPKIRAENLSINEWLNLFHKLNTLLDK